MSYVTLVGRILVGVFFVVAGIGKIGDGFGLGFGFTQTASFIASVGLPQPELLAIAAIALEIGGGIGLILGYRMYYSAMALAFVCVFTALFFHGNIEDINQRTQFFKNLSIAGGLLYMMRYGIGNDWSIEKKPNS